MRIPTLSLFSTLILLFLIAPSAAEKTRPNVLFLLSDDQRPDTVGMLGNKHIQTPNLDRIARSGVTMTRATCGNPICTPSRAEIISGASGFRNGVLDFGGPFRSGLAFWPATMKAAGYATTYVGKWHVRGRPSDYGFETTEGFYRGGGGKWWVDQQDWKGFPITGYRGWVFQSEDGKQKFPERGVGLTADISAKFADAAIDVIRRDRDRPFFLQVSFTAPHDPLIMPPGYEKKYDPSKLPLPENFLPEHPFDHGNLKGRDEKLMSWPRSPEQTRDVLAMYYRVISHMDEQVGRILSALRETGQAKNTIVIFSSDHGLAVGSHGLRGKQSMYEHTIGVPLLIRGPGIPKNVKRRAQVYLRDLFPTICELCSLPIPDAVEGRSFAGVLRGEEEEVYKQIYGYFRDKQRMIRTQRWKFIDYPQVDRQQLFDLSKDPFEMTDLSKSPDHREISLRLQSQLLAWRKRVNDPALED